MGFTLDQFRRFVPNETWETILSIPPLVSNATENQKNQHAQTIHQAVQQLFNSAFVTNTMVNLRQLKAKKTNSFSYRNEIPSFFTLEKQIVHLCAEIGFKYKSSVLEKLKNIQNDPNLTYDSITNNYINQNRDLISQMIQNAEYKYSWEINNTTIYPEIKYKEVVVQERDKKLVESRVDAKFTDLVFVVNENKFPVHRCMLSAHSKYFENLFGQQFSESKTKELELDVHVEKAAFNEFLNFVYTGAFDFSKLSLTELMEITDLAQKAEMKDLLSECLLACRRHLTSATFWQILKFAEYLQNDELKKTCTFFLEAHPKWIERHVDTNTLSIKDLLQAKSMGSYVDNKDLVTKSLEAIRKNLDLTTFQVVVDEARNKRDESLREICMSFYKNLEKMNKSAISLEIKKTYLCLCSYLDPEELNEIFVHNSAKK